MMEIIFSFTKWYACNVLFYILALFLISTAVQYVTPYNSKIRFIACYAVYISLAALFTATSIPFYILNAKAGVINCLYAAYILRFIAKIVGIDFELRNGEVLSPKTGTAVIASNHLSIWDVAGMFTKWHVMEKCTVIARKKIFYLWPFGLVAWLAGVVFIDRIPSNEKTYEKVNKAAEYVCKEKAKLWIFVEGTRNKNPEKMLPFKKGAFRVAISCQVPIIPVVISPYYFINGKTMYFGKGKVIMEALEPIPTQGLTLNDMDDLMARVYKLMSDKYEEFRVTLIEKRDQGQLPCCENL